MAKSIEQRIQELEDREQIKELTAKYCWHVAHGEGEAVANLFTDDGVLDVSDSDFKAVRGREVAAEVLSRIGARARSRAAVHPESHYRSEW